MKKYLISILLLGLIVPVISLAGEEALSVTSISAVRTSAVANGSYDDGWKWVFNLHLPASEASSSTLSFKFNDWINGATSIPVANNVRLYSTSASNASTSDSAIVISSADTYSEPLVLIDEAGDLSGRNVQVVMETRIPTGSTGGSYSTSYGILSTGTTTPALPPADCNVSFSPASPLPRLVTIPASGPDGLGIVLATYDFNSSGQNSIIDSLTFAFETDPDLGTDLFSNIKNVRLTDGNEDWIYSATGTNTATFNDLDILLTKDSNKSLTLKVDVAPKNTPYSVVPSLKTSLTLSRDVNDNTPTINGESSPYSSVADIAGNRTTFVNDALNVNGTVSMFDNTPGNPYPYFYSFVVTSTSNNPLFLSKNSQEGVVLVAMGPSSYEGLDTDSYYYLQPSSSRSLTVYSATELSTLLLNWGLSSENFNLSYSFHI